MSKHAKSSGVKLFSSKSSAKSGRHSPQQENKHVSHDDSYIREFEKTEEIPDIDKNTYNDYEIFGSNKNATVNFTDESSKTETAEIFAEIHNDETVVENNIDNYHEVSEMPKKNNGYTENSKLNKKELEDTKEIPVVKEDKIRQTVTDDSDVVSREKKAPAEGRSSKRKKSAKKSDKKEKSSEGRTGNEKKDGKVPTILVFILGFAIIAAVAYVLFFSNDADKPLTQVSPTSSEYVLSPKSVGETDPDNFITSTDVMVDDEQVDEYIADEQYTINMSDADSYTSVQGIIGYLGNNFRNSSSYGTTSLVDRTFGDEWNVDTGSLKDAMGNDWSGNGWTGQPLIVRWPDSTRENMTSMYSKYREKEDLVEVIMPCMDGKIYFMELETGEMTRDPLDIGYSFKGTGALDPRGYPILYVGSGADSELGKSRVFVINLLDNTIMYKFGYYEPFALRDWNMWDSSPIVDAETDQLIYLGENGLVYITHLNTMYDEAAGALTVNPDRTVKWRYTSSRTTTYTYWSGFESSPVCWQGMLYMSDNGGNLMCLDLNSLELKWVKDVLDDTDCSPVLSVEDDGVYIYIGTSFHPGWREEVSAAVPVWKINAVTGETVWEKDFDCVSESGLCSGVQGNVALGKNKLSGIVYVPVAEAGSANGGGYLVALDTATGEIIWEFKTSDYSWSTPVLIYDSDGNGFVVYCTMDGNFYLIDGLTGNNIAMRSINGVIESSPAVFENTIVVGTRNSKIFGIELK